MARKLKRAAKADPPRHLPRSTLEQTIATLVQRLRRQAEIANAIALVACPKGDDLVGSVPKLTVLEVALLSHANDMRQIRDFAMLFDRRPAVSS